MNGKQAQRFFSQPHPHTMGISFLFSPLFISPRLFCLLLIYLEQRWVWRGGTSPLADFLPAMFPCSIVWRVVPFLFFLLRTLKFAAAAPA